MESIRRHEVDRVSKAVAKGLDPNFHDHDSGGKEENTTLLQIICYNRACAWYLFYCISLSFLETPMTMASTLSKPRQMLLTLVSGGAHLDFRNKAGLTPMHRAAREGNKDACRVRFVGLVNGCRWGTYISPAL